MDVHVYAHYAPRRPGRAPPRDSLLAVHAVNDRVRANGQVARTGRMRLLLVAVLSAVLWCRSCSAEQTAHAAAEVGATNPTLGTYAYSDEISGSRVLLALRFALCRCCRL